jgi:CHASE3 domain sensor protein
MSAIKKMNQELERILGREPSIHEQIDILMMTTIKDRVHELQLAYQVNPSDEYREQYDFAIKCLRAIQDRNPEIFSFNDSDGGDYE